MLLLRTVSSTEPLSQELSQIYISGVPDAATAMSELLDYIAAIQAGMSVSHGAFCADSGVKWLARASHQQPPQQPPQPDPAHQMEQFQQNMLNQFAQQNQRLDQHRIELTGLSATLQKVGYIPSVTRISC
jgi:hypothetical protein